MRITIVGTGYVGLVTGACFAEMGNEVTCVDIDEAKVASLKRGEVSIYEPGLAEMVRHNFEAGRLVFESELASSVNESEITFIAVGTPQGADGTADLSHVLAVAREVGGLLARPIVIATKSTVPVGTADLVRETVTEAMREAGNDVEFDVVSNPEFLREGSAVKDFMYPDRIIVGTDNPKSQRLMEELYDAFSKKLDRIQFVGIRDAEMTKYAANVFLATKISLMNEIASLCDHYGVDVENVRRGIGSDPRIGPHFIYPGCGYGGSCFPKDVQAMIGMATHAGIEAGLVNAVEHRNALQKTVLIDKVLAYFDGDISGKTFALWGLAFKPETDDIREAPALAILAGLIDKGAVVRAFDPKAMGNVKTHIEASGLSNAVTFCSDPYEAIDQADALVVATEWREFKQPDFRRISESLRHKVVFDGRNIYSPARMRDYDLDYVGIGRGNLPGRLDALEDFAQ